MWVFISLIMINNSFWYSPISFSNIEIISRFQGIYSNTLRHFYVQILFDLRLETLTKVKITLTSSFKCLFSCLLIFHMMLLPHLPVYGRTSCICLLWKNINCFRFWWKTYTKPCTSIYVISHVKRPSSSALCSWSGAFNFTV